VDRDAHCDRRIADEGGDLIVSEVSAPEEAATALEEQSPPWSLEGLIDSVYFLMFDGWPERLESNRWHYARRWARHVPVTLLQPRARGVRGPHALADAEIPNCEILPIADSNPGATDLVRGLVQAGQVMQYMRGRGHTRPLLWSYNPRLAGLCAALPAVGRIYHATENHFDFADLPEVFDRELEASLRISDLVIPVSSGVADGIRSRIPDAHLVVVANGCDTSQYRPDGPGSAHIESARGEFGRIAAYAGTINGRLDFKLIERAAAANETTLLVFAGPVSPLAEADTEAWRRILSMGNVRHLGLMAPEELAALYRSSDLGFIPYRRERLLVENGFPLKTLEMAATGLPVVSSRMKPIVGLASAIAVSEDERQFLASFGTFSRSTLTDDERLELLEVAAENDYDRKFDQVVTSVIASVPAGRGPHTRLDDLLSDLGYGQWAAGCTRIFDRFSASPAVAFASVYARSAAILPARVRRVVPKWLKDQAHAFRVE
jgi:glycosyltransferase involved in cell wall biosynthesis